MKRCLRCSKRAGHRITHDESEFHKSIASADGLAGSCKLHTFQDFPKPKTKDDEISKASLLNDFLKRKL